MNYQKIYEQLIERARRRNLDCYSEWHHVQPRSLGGSDDPSNLVQLTYREHFLAHWLLTKICTGRGRRAMVYALQCMGTMDAHGQRFVTGWQYDVARRTIQNHFEGKRRDQLMESMRLERERQLAFYDRRETARIVSEKLKTVEPTLPVFRKQRTGPRRKHLTFDPNDISDVAKLDAKLDRKQLTNLADKLLSNSKKSRFGITNVWVH